MEGVTLTQEEQTRVQVLNSVLADQVPVCQAAEVLGVSERHMRRILAAYTHLTELLMEREGIDLSRSTVRRILVSAGMDSPRRRRPSRHRVRRKRMAQEGMLLQIGGSHHRWLGEQGPRFSLWATPSARCLTVCSVRRGETRGYFLLMEGLIWRCGMPLAVYSDRRAVFKHTGEVGRKPRGPTLIGVNYYCRSCCLTGECYRTFGGFQLTPTGPISPSRTSSISLFSAEAYTSCLAITPRHCLTLR